MEVGRLSSRSALMNKIIIIIIIDIFLKSFMADDANLDERKKRKSSLFQKSHSASREKMKKRVVPLEI